MFSQRLKELRINKGDTQKVIADYFNVSIDFLVGRTDKPEINKYN